MLLVITSLRDIFQYTFLKLYNNTGATQLLYHKGYSRLNQQSKNLPRCTTSLDVYITKQVNAYVRHFLSCVHCLHTFLN